MTVFVALAALLVVGLPVPLDHGSCCGGNRPDPSRDRAHAASRLSRLRWPPCRQGQAVRREPGEHGGRLGPPCYPAAVDPSRRSGRRARDHRVAVPPSAARATGCGNAVEEHNRTARLRPTREGLRPRFQRAAYRRRRRNREEEPEADRHRRLEGAGKVPECRRRLSADPKPDR